MPELDDILELWRETSENRASAVLATVLRTQGSSYRVPGARLLVGASGRRAGGISGGCLEEDILKKAWWLTENGPALKKYDTTPDGEIATGGYGLGCNGIIHVLLERVTREQPSILPLLGAVRTERLPASIGHIVSPGSGVGQKVVLDCHQELSSTVCDPALSQEVSRAVRENAPAEESRMLTIGESVEIFLEWRTPPIRLLVFGAGDDAIPVARMAKYLGWQVSVLDGRAHYARREKFPFADEVTITSSNAPAPAVDRWTAAVLMTHSFSQDLRILQKLDGSSLRYLGVLGPRKRTVQLLEEANLNSEYTRELIHAPMGLDIGADGPEQVALSALSEIQSIFNRRKGGFLRDRNGSIHSEETTPGQPDKWVRSIACA